MSLDDLHKEKGRERAAAVAKAVMAFETLRTKPEEIEIKREKSALVSILFVDKRLVLRAIFDGLPWTATWKDVDSVV